MWKWIAEGVVKGNIFWTDPVGDLISYFLKSRPWADRIVVIAHNAKFFDLLFVLNRLGEVDARAPHHERAEDNVPEGRECHVVRQPQLSSHANEDVARGIRSDGGEILIPTSL